MPHHFKSVDEYVSSFDGRTRERLEEIRGIVLNHLPNAEERISYNIPAYFVDKKMVIYFAGYERHIGMYPARTKSAAYNEMAAKYASGKSTARFPHDEPLPKAVIEKLIDVRLAEAGERASG